MLGYAIDHAHEGQGLMQEALQATIEHVFSVLRLHRIQANYVPDNERSGRLLERLGFVREGLAKDYLFINGAWRDHVLTARVNRAFDASIFSSRRFRPV
jgi:ribosomal-protein-alanine N-acetyltransferase